MATKPTTPPGKNGYQHRQQFGVIVICADEKHQQLTYQELKKLGHKLKVVTV